MIPVAMFFAKTIFPLWRPLPFLIFYHFLLPVIVSGVFCTTKLDRDKLRDYNTQIHAKHDENLHLCCGSLLFAKDSPELVKSGGESAKVGI